MEMTGPRAEGGGWGREIDDLLRGLTGGFLVGIPLIYTMETWWIGETVSMPRALAFVGCAYAVNLAFVTVMGFRGRAPGAGHPLTEALEATGLAVVAAAATLALLYQIRPGSPLDVVVGRIAVDMLPISLGVSVAHLILAPRETRLGSEDGGAGGDGGAPDAPRWRALVLDLGAAFAGALFFGLSIAPTEEVPMLATEVPVLYLPLVILFSLALTYGIVFEAEFGGRERRRRTPGPFQRPVTETVLAYLTSLLTCAGLLWLYGQIDAGDDWFVAFTRVVVLGLPAAIGAAAGRLAV
jgi:putative integral membrane protein (TIGR02587 family)